MEEDEAIVISAYASMTAPNEQAFIYQRGLTNGKGGMVRHGARKTIRGDSRAWDHNQGQGPLPATQNRSSDHRSRKFYQ